MLFPPTLSRQRRPSPFRLSSTSPPCPPRAPPHLIPPAAPGVEGGAGDLLVLGEEEVGELVEHGDTADDRRRRYESVVGICHHQRAAPQADRPLRPTALYQFPFGKGERHEPRKTYCRVAL